MAFNKMNVILQHKSKCLRKQNLPEDLQENVEFLCLLALTSKMY